MTKDDIRSFAKCMAALGEAFSLDVSDLKREVYFDNLEDLDIHDIERAVRSIIQTRGTASFPKVAEIRIAITGDPEDRAQIALSKLEDALNSHRGSGSVKFHDKVIHMAITRMCGWIELSDIIDRGEWKFRRSEFLKIYKACINFPCEYPEILEGTHRRDNISKGFTLDRAKEFGWSAQKIKVCLGYIDADEPSQLMIDGYSDDKRKIA